MKRILVIVGLLLVSACGQGDDSASPSTPAPSTPVDVAHEYALELSGGVTTGCSDAAPGAEAESTPGCIYSVAFAGCSEGLTGEQLSPLPVEEEFASEPGLVEIYRRARADCAG